MRTISVMSLSSEFTASRRWRSVEARTVLARVSCLLLPGVALTYTCSVTPSSQQGSMRISFCTSSGRSSLSTCTTLATDWATERSGHGTEMVLHV